RPGPFLFRGADPGGRRRFVRRPPGRLHIGLLTLTIGARHRYSARSLRVCARLRAGRRADRLHEPLTGGGTPPERPLQTAKAMTVRTYNPKPGDVQRQWHVIDATDVVLGRLAPQAAILLRGKQKPIYAPHV